MTHSGMTHEGSATAPHPVLGRYYANEAEHRPFVNTLFDKAAPHYDWLGAVLSLGSQHAYRRLALHRAGVGAGMRVLDVATGTGLVAGEARRLVGETGSVVGVDPNPGMLGQARRVHDVRLVQGRAEDLPFDDDAFDALSMGYALRHVASLEVAFREYRRVLRPGGRLLLLEISRPTTRVGRWLLRGYLQCVAPLLARVRTRNRYAGLLMRYYWDTIVQCVPPETILAVLRESGFDDVRRRLTGGIFSEYTATKPAAG